MQPFREKADSERDPDKKTMLQNTLVRGRYMLNTFTIVEYTSKELSLLLYMYTTVL